VDPKPQLIAEAIMAYQWNNQMRTTELNRQTLDVMTIPCLTIVSTWPTFYLVQVTKELNTYVAWGEFPKVQIIVRKCSPHHHRMPGEMMIDSLNRQMAFEYYDTFCRLAEEHWESFLI
jgi:hypothetical protein